MLDEKPNKKLMAQLRLVVRHADAFGDALRQTNIPDPNFPKAELMEHITSLKELPDGLVRGVIEIIPPIRDRLTDMKLDFLETEDEEDASDNAPPKLQRGNNLDKAIDQLLGSLGPAYTLALRQVGQSMPDEEPEVLLRTNERPDISQTRDTLTEAYVKLSKGQDQVDEILDAAGIDETDADRERLDRSLQYGKTTARVINTELGFGQVAIKRLKTLGKALKYVPKLIKGAAKAIEFGAMVGKPIFEAFEEWGRETISSAFDAVAKGARGVHDAVEAFERGGSKVEAAPEVFPPVDPEVQAEAQLQAIKYLRNEESIPGSIGINVREIVFDEGDGLTALDFENLSELPYLTRIKSNDYLENRIQIRNLQLISQHKWLKVIEIYSSDITDLSPLKALAKLEILRLDSATITDFSPLQNLKNLKELDLDRTRITDLTPLQSLVNLELLTLDSTPVIDISPLSSLINLKTLDLDRTQIGDISTLQNLKNLRTVYLNGTQITDWNPVSHVPSVLGRPKDWQTRQS